MKKYMNNQSRFFDRRATDVGFSLVEVMVSVSILAFVILGVMSGYLYFSSAKEIAGNKIKAVIEAQNKIEEIRNANFNDIYSTYDDTAFSLTQVNGTGFINIDNTTPELLEIKIVVNWESGDGRILGEDQNLNGVLDISEDTDADGEVDSPITIRTLLTRR